MQFTKDEKNNTRNRQTRIKNDFVSAYSIFKIMSGEQRIVKCIASIVFQAKNIHPKHKHMVTIEKKCKASTDF